MLNKIYAVLAAAAAGVGLLLRYLLVKRQRDQAIKEREEAHRRALAHSRLREKERGIEVARDLARQEAEDNLAEIERERKEGTNRRGRFGDRRLHNERVRDD